LSVTTTVEPDSSILRNNSRARALNCDFATC
jgi:hypothetical protein